MGIRQGGGARHFGARDAAIGIIELVVIRDHVADRKQAALGGDQLDEIGGDSGNAGLVEQRAERLDLILGREDRAAHQALEIGALSDHAAEGLHRGSDLIGRLALARQGEQGQGVAPRHSRNDVFLLRQWLNLSWAQSCWASPQNPAPRRGRQIRGTKRMPRGGARAPRTPRRALRNIGLLAAQPDFSPATAARWERTICRAAASGTATVPGASRARSWCSSR